MKGASFLRRFRLFLVVFIVIAAAGASGVAYLNRSVLPAKARLWVQKTASEALGRPVTVERVQIHWWHGFVLEKVAIAESGSFGAQPLLEVDQISGGVLFLPIFKNREFVIPTLHLVRPRLRLLQNSQGAWNVRALKPKPAASPPVPPRFRVLIPHLLLSEGRVEVLTQKTEPPLSLHLQEIRVDARLNLPAQVEWSASLEIQAVPPVPITLEGTYDLPKRRFQVKSRSDWVLPVLLSHLPEEQQSRVGSLDGTVSLDLEAAGTPGGPVDLTAWLETEGLRWKKELEAQGEVRARIEGKIPAWPASDFWRNLKGSITLDRIHLRPLPTVGELRELSGQIQVDAKGARTERLTATLPPGIPVEMSGSIANNDERSVGFRLSTLFRLEQPPPLPGKMLDFMRNAQLAGQARLELLASGTLRHERSFRLSGTITLEGCSAEYPKGCRWSDGQAVLKWQPDLLTFSPIRAQFLDRPLELEGTLVNFTQPEVDAQLTWGALSAEAHLGLTGEKIEVENVSGRAGPATFRILGEIGRPEPVANLFAESSFRIEQMEALAPQSLAWISKNGLAGECDARLLVQGDLSRMPTLDADLRISSPKLTVRQIPLETFSAEIGRDSGVTELRSAQAILAGGSVRISGSVRGNEPKKPWDGRVTVQNLDLAQLGEILQWKNQTLSGQMMAEWSGGGQGTDPASLSGEGSVRIGGAHILEFPLLGRFADLVGAPTLRTLAFQEAQGAFRLNGGKIHTDNFQLTSPQASITLAGWGGFLQGADSPIAWRFIPAFAPELIPEETRSKLGKVIARGTSYLMGEVQVTGTWKDPKKKFISKPVTQILNEQLLNLQDILKDLF